MDTKALDRLAKANAPLEAGATLFERWYYIGLRGLYAQYKAGQISLEQAEHDKEVIVDAFAAHIKGPKKEIIYLNRDKVVEATLLELGRYMSCGQNFEQREKAYPRKLFEERIVKVIDQAYKET